MYKKILLIALCGVLLFGVTGCSDDDSTKENSNNKNNVQENNSQKEDNNKQEKFDNNQTTSGESNDSSNKYYTGTYYLSLTDGTLAKDGSGTIILNEDGTCAYYYGWSNFGCVSYTVNDHLITLKTTENASDIYLTLDVDNKVLIDANNEKYLKEEQ